MSLATLQHRFAGLSSTDQITLVKRQIGELETQAAALWLTASGLPADQQAINRLAFGRYLAVTLRLKEYSV